MDELKARLDAAPADELAKALREGLAPLLGMPYRVDSGVVGDDAGTRSTAVSVLIHAPVEEPTGTGEAICVNDLAIALAVVDELRPKSLAQAYEVIASVKALAKPGERKGVASHSNATLGVIYARQSAVSVEEVAEQLQALNQGCSSDLWPDIVCVGDKAVLEYCVQFPGHSRFSAWFPATPGGFARGAPAVYIVLVKTPSGAGSFIRTLGQMFKFLAIFRKGADLPNGSQELSGAAGSVLPSAVYQYDLAGQLRPLREDQNRDRIAPDAALRIVDQKGEPLAGFRYMPWQDGGAIVMEGKFPLEGVLVFAPERQNATVLRPLPDLHISYVLRMNRRQFAEMLDRFQQRSNLKVERPPGKWIVRRMADEGTASPYVARLMLGILTLRDVTLPEGDPLYDRFDAKFERVSQSLASVRASADAICAMWAEHEVQVREGRIVKRGPTTVTITANIDRELRRECESFLTTAARLLKLNMQELSAVLGVDIGFLFKQQGAFNDGVARLGNQDAELAAYLEQIRGRWSERLIKARIAVEHDGWTLPSVAYSDDGRTVSVKEPEVAGEGVTAFVTTMLDRLCCFIEEVTAHLLVARLPPIIGLWEVPKDRRPGDNPARFELVMADGGRPPWRLTYSDAAFLDR